MRLWSHGGTTRATAEDRLATVLLKVEGQLKLGVFGSRQGVCAHTETCAGECGHEGELYVPAAWVAGGTHVQGVGHRRVVWKLVRLPVLV